MAALTLAEMARATQVKDPILEGIVKVYTQNAPILGDGQNIGAALPALKFETTTTDGSGGVSFVRQKTLPTTGWRATNVEFVAQAGETEKVSETLKIGGGAVQVDRILRQRVGDAGLAEQIDMTIASFARTWNKAFYKGNGAGNSITGLQARITGAQSVDNLGGGVNLYLLDKVLLDLRGTDRVLAMGTGVAARIMQAAKTSNNVNYVPANFGVSPATYNGVPMLLAGEDIDESEILGFTEAGDTSSIYVLSLGANGVVGKQSAPLGYFNTNGERRVDSSFVVEWDNNFLIKTVRSAYRLRNILNAAANSEAPVS
jgi:hypothetical protein